MRMVAMIVARLMLTGSAALLFALGIAVLRKQATAHSCPAHSRLAGQIATLLAWLLMLGSAGLALYAWTLL